MKYEVTFQVKQETEKGEKLVKNLYLVEALSIIEAVTKTTKVVAEDYGEYQDIAAKCVGYDEVYTCDEEEQRYYKVKYNILTIDERTAAEKKTPHICIFQANDLNSAKKKYEEEIKKWLVDVELASISETKIQQYIQ